jgi:biopolymer transport protein ExbB
MKNVKTMFAAIVIPVALIVAYLIYSFVLGNPANFIEGNPAGEPVKEGVGSYLGVIYKGGIIVPILIAMLLIVITFTVESMLTINAAKGKGSVDAFISRIRALVTSHDFSAQKLSATARKVLLPTW